jgi:hypothetical protein
MKVNYHERIDLSVGELKIILSKQRTIANDKKFRHFIGKKLDIVQALQM